MAAADLFAEMGPGAVSIRSIAERAGCSHTLIGSHFGSKKGLENEVFERVAKQFRALAKAALTASTWSASDVLIGLRRDSQATRLAIHSALGEFGTTSILGASTLGPRLSYLIELRRDGDPADPSAAARCTAFFVLHTLLGYITFEPLLVFGTRTADVEEPTRDAAITEAADLIIKLGSDPNTDLGWGPDPRRLPERPSVIDPTLTAKEALIVATIDLYVERGPGRVTTRDISQRADVIQGLIYHYFDSLEDLTVAALTVAAAPFSTSAMSSDRFDLARLARNRPDLDFLIIIARHLIAGRDLSSLGVSMRVFDSILERYGNLPVGAGPGGLADPRLARMAASGYYPDWDREVRAALGVPMTGDLSAAGITVVTSLLDRPVR